MKYLNIIWIRIVIALFCGGMAAGLIHIATGDPNRPMTTNFSVLYAAIIFGILTFIVRHRKGA